MFARLWFQRPVKLAALYRKVFRQPATDSPRSTLEAVAAQRIGLQREGIGPVFIQVYRTVNTRADIDLLEIQVYTVFVVEKRILPVEGEALFIVTRTEDAAFAESVVVAVNPSAMKVLDMPDRLEEFDASNAED